jgi:hypothetical protein
MERNPTAQPCITPEVLRTFKVVITAGWEGMRTAQYFKRGVVGILKLQQNALIVISALADCDYIL